MANEKRLIDANALLRHKRKMSGADFGGEFWDEAVLASDIEAAPTVDIVPVIRCRECKQGEIDDPDFPDEYYCHAGCGWNKGDFYCAYRERKEGADNEP